MFSTDNLVVYPAQGVGKIERIDQKNIGGISCEFYIVNIRANNITLMVPVKNALNVGLRGLVSKNQASKILKNLYNNIEQSIITGQNWNRRFREYSERMKSPDLNVVAEVLRELLIIGRGKDLSFGERRLLDQAMNLVTGELSIVLNMEPEDMREKLILHYSPQTQENNPESN